MKTSNFSVLETGTVVCPLDHLGLVQFEGEDAQAFLQGQLTNDTKLIADNRSQLAGYCTAKGRLLATLLLWKTADGFCAQLHGGIAAAVQKRLGMYVLRSRVKVADAASLFARFGVAGQGAEALLAGFVQSLPPQAMDTVQQDGVTLIRLHGAVPRFELVVPAADAADWRTKLEAGAAAGDAALWDWLEIRAGVPQIGPETQEQFVPQMVNLDLLDGINLKKGCYTGQEIVARTHYLGKVKRRMQLAHVASAELPAAGAAVFGVDSAEAVGQVVYAAPAPDGGFDLLAEVRLESVEAGELRLAGQDGSVLQLLELPYGF